MEAWWIAISGRRNSISAQSSEGCSSTVRVPEEPGLDIGVDIQTKRCWLKHSDRWADCLLRQDLIRTARLGHRGRTGQMKALDRGSDCSSPLRRQS